MGESAGRTRQARAGETILVVDDEELARTDACRILRAEGYTAIPVRRGLAAQWCVDRHAPRVDLLVVDLTDPAMDDYHLGIVVGPLRPYTPFLFISAAGRAESVRRGLLHPRAPFLQKPFPPYALTRTVRRVLDRWMAPPAA